MRKDYNDNIAKLFMIESGKNIRIISGNSNRSLAECICKFLNVELCNALIGTFPDGESSVMIKESIRGDDVFIIQSCDYPANQNYMELLIMIDTARRASAARITVVLPFFGYARQDRKNQPRVPVTAKLIANLLVAVGADRILTMDLHSQQLVGFFDIPVDHLFASKLFIDYLRRKNIENLMICSPDLGGMKLAATYADVLHCAFGSIAKRRVNSEKVEALSIIGNITNKDVLLTDDMTVTFETLEKAAQLLKQNGAHSVRAAVSHCLLTENGYSLFERGSVDELITTNSTGISYHFQKCPKITILSIDELLGEAIKRIHTDTSISDLFEIKGF